MPNPIIKIVNVTTGEEVEREMTSDEMKIEADAKKIQEKIDLEIAELNAPKLAAKIAAQAKLAALGLTTDDLRALGL
jgi:hypothetical protein